MAHLIRRGRSRYVAFSLLLASASVLSMRAGAIECDKSQPKQACDINIDPSTVVNGRTFHVRNGTPVTVTVYPKSPFERCSMVVKDREVIKEDNAFQTLLSIVAQAGVPIALLAPALSSQRCRSCSRQASTIRPGTALSG